MTYGGELDPRYAEQTPLEPAKSPEQQASRELRLKKALEALDAILNNFNSKHASALGRPIHYKVVGGRITLLDLPRYSLEFMQELYETLEKDEQFLLWAPEGWLNYYFPNA